MTEQEYLADLAADHADRIAADQAYEEALASDEYAEWVQALSGQDDQNPEDVDLCPNGAHAIHTCRCTQGRFDHSARPCR